jgi:hypothetical protein
MMATAITTTRVTAETAVTTAQQHAQHAHTTGAGSERARLFSRSWHLAFDVLEAETGNTRSTRGQRRKRLYNSARQEQQGGEKYKQ